MRVPTCNSRDFRKGVGCCEFCIVLHLKLEGLKTFCRQDKGDADEFKTPLENEGYVWLYLLPT
jgi:hypothetical protein